METGMDSSGSGMASASSGWEYSMRTPSKNFGGSRFRRLPICHARG
jgi:hypothetical protein